MLLLPVIASVIVAYAVWGAKCACAHASWLRAGVIFVPRQTASQFAQARPWGSVPSASPNPPGLAESHRTCARPWHTALSIKRPVTVSNWEGQSSRLYRASLTNEG